VSRNSLLQGRADYDKVFLELETDATVLAEVGGALIETRDFRLEVAGQSYEPQNQTRELFSEGTGGRIPVVFEMSDDVRELGLLVNVGWNDDDGDESQAVNIMFTP
jgi:hypothetical protein